MSAADDFTSRQLELFAERCRELAERVNLDLISFIDAIDMAYSAATWSGLSDSVGDHTVQAVMRNAFMGARHP